MSPIKSARSGQPPPQVAFGRRVQKPNATRNGPKSHRSFGTNSTCSDATEQHDADGAGSERGSSVTTSTNISATTTTSDWKNQQQPRRKPAQQGIMKVQQQQFSGSVSEADSFATFGEEEGGLVRASAGRLQQWQQHQQQPPWGEESSEVCSEAGQRTGGNLDRRRLTQTASSDISSAAVEERRVGAGRGGSGFGGCSYSDVSSEVSSIVFGARTVPNEERIWDRPQRAKVDRASVLAGGAGYPSGSGLRRGGADGADPWSAEDGEPRVRKRTVEAEQAGGAGLPSTVRNRLAKEQIQPGGGSPGKSERLRASAARVRPQLDEEGRLVAGKSSQDLGQALAQTMQADGADCEPRHTAGKAPGDLSAKRRGTREHTSGGRIFGESVQPPCVTFSGEKFVGKPSTFRRQRRGAEGAAEPQFDEAGQLICTYGQPNAAREFPDRLPQRGKIARGHPNALRDAEPAGEPVYGATSASLGERKVDNRMLEHVSHRAQVSYDGDAAGRRTQGGGSVGPKTSASMGDLLRQDWAATAARSEERSQQQRPGPGGGDFAAAARMRQRHSQIVFG